LQIAKNHSLLSDLTTKNALLTQENTTLKTVANEIKDQNKLLTHDKWILAQEKSELLGKLKQTEAMI